CSTATICITGAAGISSRLTFTIVSAAPPARPGRVARSMIPIPLRMLHFARSRCHARSSLLGRFTAPGALPLLVGALVVSLLPSVGAAQEGGASSHAPAITFLWIAFLLVAARVSGLV